MPVINFSLFLYVIYISSVLEFSFVEFGSACSTVSIKYMQILKYLLFIILENFIHLDNSSGYSSLSQVTVGRKKHKDTLAEWILLTIWVWRIHSTDKVIWKIKTVQREYWPSEQRPAVYCICWYHSMKSAFSLSLREVISCLKSSRFRKLNLYESILGKMQE